MLINLRELPDKLPPPQPPDKTRWLFIILLCTAAGSAIALLFWPGEMQPASLWFWCCVLVFPLAGGCFVFGLRQFAYENRLDYVESWNSSRAEIELHLLEQGQRRIAVLASAYCTPAGSNRLAEALRLGSKPLHPVFQPATRLPITISPLVAEKPQEQSHLYAERLTAYLDRVLAVLVPDLQQRVPTQPMAVRIRHNQVLSDAQVLALWTDCAQRKALNIESARVANGDDGLMWLDTWLDNPGHFPLLLSVELNLFDQPVAGQAESVSALLFAYEDFCAEQQIAPTAWVHRPLTMACDPHSTKEVLLWGRFEEGSEPFAWQIHVGKEQLHALHGALVEQGCPLAVNACLRLDDNLGAPGSAVGNIAVIVGSEQAATDRQPQLLMVQDATPQWCVVQPAQ